MISISSSNENFHKFTSIKREFPTKAKSLNLDPTDPTKLVCKLDPIYSFTLITLCLYSLSLEILTWNIKSQNGGVFANVHGGNTIRDRSQTLVRGGLMPKKISSKNFQGPLLDRKFNQPPPLFFPKENRCQLHRKSHRLSFQE